MRKSVTASRHAAVTPPKSRATQRRNPGGGAGGVRGSVRSSLFGNDAAAATVAGGCEGDVMKPVSSLPTRMSRTPSNPRTSIQRSSILQADAPFKAPELGLQPRLSVKGAVRTSVSREGGDTAAALLGLQTTPRSSVLESQGAPLGANYGFVVAEGLLGVRLSKAENGKPMEVTEVLADSIAMANGVKVGDVLVQINGTPVTAEVPPKELKELLRLRPVKLWMLSPSRRQGGDDEAAEQQPLEQTIKPGSAAAPLQPIAEDTGDGERVSRENTVEEAAASGGGGGAEGEAEDTAGGPEGEALRVEAQVRPFHGLPARARADRKSAESLGDESNQVPAQDSSENLKPCVSCNEPLETTAKFCGTCGAQQSAQTDVACSPSDSDSDAIVLPKRDAAAEKPPSPPLEASQGGAAAAAAMPTGLLGVPGSSQALRKMSSVSASQLQDKKAKARKAIRQSLAEAMEEQDLELLEVLIPQARRKKVDEAEIEAAERLVEFLKARQGDMADIELNGVGLEELRAAEDQNSALLEELAALQQRLQAAVSSEGETAAAEKVKGLEESLLEARSRFQEEKLEADARAREELESLQIELEAQHQAALAAGASELSEARQEQQRQMMKWSKERKMLEALAEDRQEEEALDSFTRLQTNRDLERMQRELAELKTIRAEDHASFEEERRQLEEAASAASPKKAAASGGQADVLSHQVATLTSELAAERDARVLAEEGLEVEKKLRIGSKNDERAAVEKQVQENKSLREKIKKMEREKQLEIETIPELERQIRGLQAVIEEHDQNPQAQQLQTMALRIEELEKLQDMYEQGAKEHLLPLVGVAQSAAEGIAHVAQSMQAGIEVKSIERSAALAEALEQLATIAEHLSAQAQAVGGTAASADDSTGELGAGDAAAGVGVTMSQDSACASSMTLADVDFEEKLGSGAVGTVWKGTTEYGGKGKRTVAIKKYTPEGITDFKTESSVLAKLRHPNVVEMIGFITEKDQYYVVIEVLRPPVWETIDKMQAIRDVLVALTYCHDVAKVVHLDIKLDNLMQDIETNAIKIIDFSVAQEDADELYDGFYGSLPFAAPEMCQATPWDGRPADIFSVGVVLAFLLDVQALFQHLGWAVEMNNATEDERLSKASQLEDSVRYLSEALGPAAGSHGQAGDLVGRLLSVLPQERPSATEALQHKWFAPLASTPDG
eukprot:TRINITY_DN7604_c0_g5_i1.p1 TRINITY_DN7604_c0_g5~~TRINITY_DN7604_c0_g5_i1.p1  ORF type:complete len:1187 (+),score=383.42 TRINITY_DN7604_c0_g5_i1:136-3696(+)